MKLKKRNKKKENREVFQVLYEQAFIQKICLFFVRVFRDLFRNSKDKKFKEYGLSCFVGRQGSGKSISIVVELERIRRDYPDVLIMTNFGYQHEHQPLNDWQQLIDCRNDAGIVFAIDEIQNEFDVYDSRNFNLDILKVITQQRKQGIKILASSQVFTRVSKPLREQCYEVIECYTVLSRWTFLKCFDADDYNLVIDNPNPEKVIKINRKWRRNYVQSDVLRSKYNSYKVIESMKKLVRAEKKREKIRSIQ